MASALDTQIAALQADVAAEATAVQAVITYLIGVPALIAAAVVAAQAAGATAAQLAALTALGTSVTTDTANLSAALAAETGPPAAGGPPAA